MFYRKRNLMRLYVVKAGVSILLEEIRGSNRVTTATVLRHGITFENDELREIIDGQMHFHNHNVHYYINEKDVIVVD